MALRLKYAGIPAQKLTVEQEFEALLDWMSRQDKPVFIIPTYTAMLDIRTKLAHLCGSAEFWE